MRTRLSKGLDEPPGQQRLDHSRRATVSRQRLRLRHDAAANHDGHGVLAGIAGIEAGHAVFRVRVRRVVCVCRQPVPVLGVIVIGIDVRVP
jgi:hypothetical protein